MSQAQRVKVLQEVMEERTRQDTKHGEQHGLPHIEHHLYTLEEVGEVTKALNEHLFRPTPTSKDELRAEIVQATACFVKWLEVGDW